MSHSSTSGTQAPANHLTLVNSLGAIAVRAVLLLLGLGLIVPIGCGSDKVRSPFGPGAGGAGGAAGAGGDGGLELNVDPGDQTDPTLGGPCQDDGQCDDQVKCTEDHCDTDLGRCRFQPRDAACDDGVYCNGVERCNVRAGCTLGDPVACSDNITCTIDVCVEDTQSCKHEPRDADGDGDPVRNCGGHDCNDSNPLVSSLAAEICGNKRDDDCDGEIDEKDCVAPEHDTCDTALAVTDPGFYDFDLTATALDYPTKCAGEDAGFRDVVMQVTVPAGGPYDLDITAKVDSGKVSLGTASQCGDKPSVSCVASFDAPLGGDVSRLMLRGVSAGTYPVYVAADKETGVQVHVERRSAEPQPGELCEQAVPLVAGGDALLFRLPGYAPDVKSGCAPLTGDAFASFELAEASDVILTAEAQNGLGEPVISLLDATCKTELTCRHSQPGRLFDRNLPAGSYRVLVAASAPDDIRLRLETGPVTAAPPGEGCSNSLPLVPGVEQVIDLSNHEDAVDTGCLTGASDVTFDFQLKTTQDVALVGRLSDGDVGAISISNPTCSAETACRVGSGTLRSTRYALAPGSYRAVMEAEAGNPIGLSWFARPAVATITIPHSDNCDAPDSIPETGGTFVGNTGNAFPDFDAGCDVGGQEQGGAPDQILKLTLTKRRRVIFDMQGSGYQTMLSVRQGQFCPGAELPMACAPGYDPTRSYLDLNLDPGDYFVQIDGYDGASGAWKLDVFSAPL